MQCLAKFDIPRGGNVCLTRLRSRRWHYGSLRSRLWTLSCFIPYCGGFCRRIREFAAVSVTTEGDLWLRYGCLLSSSCVSPLFEICVFYNTRRSLFVPHYRLSTWMVRFTITPEQTVPLPNALSHESLIKLSGCSIYCSAASSTSMHRFRNGRKMHTPAVNPPQQKPNPPYTSLKQSDPT